MGTQNDRAEKDGPVILNRVERGEGSLVDLREILRSLKLPQDDLIHQDSIHKFMFICFVVLRSRMWGSG